MDTTSPLAMTTTLQKIVLDDALSVQSRHHLQHWLSGNTTGGKRLKAGLPKDWKIGDKTGTNQTDTNDIGVIWPPNRAPVLMSAYLADSKASRQVNETRYCCDWRYGTKPRCLVPVLPLIHYSSKQK